MPRFGRYKNSNFYFGVKDLFYLNIFGEINYLFLILFPVSISWIDLIKNLIKISRLILTEILRIIKNSAIF